MKKAVVISVAYIGLFLLSLTLLTTLLLIFFWVSTYSPELQALHFFEPAMRSLLYSLPAAVALSLMLVLIIRTRTRKRAPVLSIVVSIIAITLYTGTALVTLQVSDTIQISEHNSFPFYEHRLSQIENTMLYTGRISFDSDQTATITPLLTLDMEKQQPPRISYFKKGTSEPEHSSITVPEENKTIEYIPQITPFYTFVGPPEFLHQILGEIQGIILALKQSAQKGWIFLLLTTASHVLFLTAGWSVIRSSKWPLMNALLALLMIRAFFFLDAALHGGVFAEMLKVLSLDSYVFLAPPIAFLILAALFGLWGLLYNPAASGAENE